MNNPNHERELLFCLLALQNDCISREDFVSVFTTWISEKAVPLDRAILNHGLLPQDEYQLLQALVDAHLKLHNDDPAHSLRALSDMDSLREQLQKVADSAFAETLMMLGHGQAGDEPLSSDDLPEADKTGLVQTRFRILRHHARGGLGDVFVARDQDLNREVALKEIQSSHVHRTDSRSRFVLEAEVTGGLEHPGIVPVYALGQHADGRPFYAMRFIRGDSLQEAIEQFHSGGGGIGDEGQTLVLRNLLGRFVDVCQAVDYAHSRGVLHRDLKPGNIMLGKYGETLVVDWGLAKTEAPLTRANADAGLLKPLSGSISTATQVGSALGTPAYMPPEQASGHLDALGPASDVYSLGATLYHLLTGQAPFRGRDIGELLDRVRAGAFVAPRDLDSRIPPALNAICLRAMATAPEDRYQSPHDLAEDIERFLADEPVTAFSESLPVRSRRWMRKHPRIVAGTAVSLLFGLASSIVFTSIVASTNQALAEKNAELDRTNALLTESNDRLNDSNAALARANAQEILARGIAEREQDVSQAILSFVQHDLLMQADLNAQADRMLETGRSAADTQQNPTILEILDRASETLVDDGIELRFPGEPVVQAEILMTLGLTYEAISQHATAIRHLQRARDLLTKASGPTAPRTLSAIVALATSYRSDGRSQEAIPLLEMVLEERTRALGAEHDLTLQAANTLAAAYESAGMVDEALTIFRERYAIDLRIHGPDGIQTELSRANLGYGLFLKGDFAAALPLIQTTYDNRLARLGDQHPMVLDAAGNLASILKATGSLDQALPLFERILELRKEKQGADHAHTLLAANNLAVAYSSAGRFAEAAELLQDTLNRSRSSLGEDHPETLSTLNDLAATFYRLGKIREALPLMQMAFEKTRALRGDDHRDTLSAMNNLASVHLTLDEPQQAIPLLERCLELRRAKYSNDDPRTVLSIGNLAQAYLSVPDSDKAVPLYEEFLRWHRTNVPPEQAADVHDSVALTLFQQGQVVLAGRFLSESLALRSESSPNTWSRYRTQGMLAVCLTVESVSLKDSDPDAAAQKLARAETLLADAWKWLESQEPTLAPATFTLYRSQVAHWMTRLYTAMNDAGKVDHWKQWAE